jgi:O-antigen/teichoic acid export membrane protein
MAAADDRNVVSPVANGGLAFGDRGALSDLPPVPRMPVAEPRGFLSSVLWNWFGVSVSLFSAFILSPFIIRRLGDENYGLWALTTSLVEYYWLLDFGLRSATFQYAATYNATGEKEKINELINTNIAYSLILFPLLIASAWFGGPLVVHLMHITHPLFSKLILIVVLSWALTSLLSVFSTAMEGIQRFDITNQATIAGIALRSFGTAALLLVGYGVVAMAWMGMAAQAATHLISFWRARRVFPFLAFSRRFCSLKMFRQMLGYGAHSVAASVSQRILSQSPPLLIGYFLPTRFVGYYTAPMRLLDYTAVTVMRIGTVANSKAALLFSTGRKSELLALSITVNRYSLALFLPFSIYLAIYGPQLLAVWITPQFARESAGVLVALLAGITLGNAAQFSSTSILFGMGKHRMFARAMLVEAALTTAAMAFLLPRYGLTAAAMASSAMMMANRALFTPYLLARELDTSYWRFLASVNRPLVAVLPVGAALLALKHVVPGSNWPQLILAGLVTMLAYIPIAYGFVRPEDRTMFLERLRHYRERAGFSRAAA